MEKVKIKAGKFKGKTLADVKPLIEEKVRQGWTYKRIANELLGITTPTFYKLKKRFWRWGIKLDKMKYRDHFFPNKPDWLVEKQLREVFALDASWEEAAVYIGEKPEKLREFVEEKPELKEELEILRHKPILKARQTVNKRLEESYQNAIDYLQRKRPQEFGGEQKTPPNVAIAIIQQIIKENEGRPLIGERIREIQVNPERPQVAAQQPLPNNRQKREKDNSQAELGARILAGQPPLPESDS